jgi:CHAT domain
MRDRPSAKTILLLASNPTNTARLRLDEEAREIAKGLRMGTHRDQFVFQRESAVRPEDIRQALLTFNPQIVHFCGHGVGMDGLALENEKGQVQLVPTAALADFFALFSDRLECVLLNACYSDVQAVAISQHIDYVIGMSQAVGDRAAIQFALGFYDALGAGRTYEDAYKFGCNAIAMYQIPQDTVPKIRKKRTDRVKEKESDRPVPKVQSPLQKNPSTPIRPGHSSNRRASSKAPSKPASQRAKSAPFFLTAKKIWFFLLPIIAIWGFVGMLQQDWIDAPNSQGLISLICLGAFGGLISGVLISVAQQTIFPERDWLPALFLRSLIGMVSGSLLWAMFGSLLPIQNNGLMFGLLFGLIATIVCVWKLNPKRSRA